MTFPYIEFSKESQTSGADALTLAQGWWFEFHMTDGRVVEGMLAHTLDNEIVVETAEDDPRTKLNVSEIERMVYT